MSSKASFVQINAAFTLDFQATNPYACSPPLTTGFQVQINGGSPPYSYDWKFGDGNTSAAPSPTHTYYGSGAFT
ncbi:MAG: PKD domain-containing protein, partial [Bacteroidota bacterium]|nr:PKD domain-containing protein [Bacteroidota bacterium]MDX5430752.1 PKD domain-containing protein [Bacteroidota bacterium]MDX5469497.1 PKD domain-containing protein [Bacteroidota bacterium]